MKLNLIENNTRIAELDVNVHYFKDQGKKPKIPTTLELLHFSFKDEIPEIYKFLAQFYDETQTKSEWMIRLNTEKRIWLLNKPIPVSLDFHNLNFTRPEKLTTEVLICYETATLEQNT